MDFRSACKIAKINLRHNFLSHFIIAAVIAILTPVVFEISVLNKYESAQPLEMLLSLTGTVLLTPIFLPEQNENIRDLMRSKRIDYLAVCFIRLLYSMFFLAIIFAFFTLIMYHYGSEVTMYHFIGGYISALFLGALGLFFAGICKNTIIGYMTSMIFYMSNFLLKNDLKNLFIFSMSSGSFQEKYWLLSSSAFLIVFLFLYLKLVKK